MGKVEKTLCFEQLVAYAISPTTHQLALVLPFRELTLSRLINERSNSDKNITETSHFKYLFSPNDILAIAMGLAGAIKALHDMGIAYNRLTPNNVLISEVPEAILSIVECPSPIAQQGFQSGRYFPTIAGFGAAHCFHETTGLLHIPKQCFSFEIQKPADPIRAYYGEKNLSSSFGELDFQDDETGPKLNGIVSSALDPRYISHDIIALIMRQMDSTVQEKNVLGFSEIALPSSDQHRWQQSDLISFGIVLREMLTRQAPYSNVDSVKKVIEHQMAELSVDLTYGDPTPNIAGFESEQCHRLRLRLWDVGQQCFKAKSNLFIHQIEDYLLQLVHQFEES
jgi:serine/threonine protein kinase